MFKFYATPRQFLKSNFAPIWLLLIPMLLASFTAFSQVSLQLTPSSYNGFNISCFGASNGSINLTITGGTPPYSILWSTNETSEDLVNLPAGYYRVTVNDADTSTGPVEAEITLIEPRKLTLTVSAYKYPNNFNISLYEACNGAISLNATDGVAPYIWLWNDGNTSQNRTSLCAETFAMTVTDANGCTDKNLNTKLFQPDRSDWQITGNENINANNHFIGTVDGNDLVFKSNNFERARLKANGDFLINRIVSNRIVSQDSLIYFGDSTIMFATSYNRLYGDPTGTTNKGTAIGLRAFCPGLYSSSIGYNTSSTGQYSTAIGYRVQAQQDYSFVIGSGTPGTNLNNNFSNSIMLGCNSTVPTVFISSANGGTTTGNVGIGTTDIPAGYKLVVDGGKAGFREVFVKLTGPWPDYVFDSEYKLQPPSEIEKFFRENKHLQNMPSAKDIETDGQNIGEIQRVQQEHI